jgi:hypothetical protein
MFNYSCIPYYEKLGLVKYFYEKPTISIYTSTIVRDIFTRIIETLRAIKNFLEKCRS